MNFINKDNKGKISEFLAPCILLKYDYYQKVLDFTKNFGNISIFFSIGDPFGDEGLIFNEEENDLFCQP